MNTPNSEDNKSKSNSNTSDSERQYIRKRIFSFVYPTMPETNISLRGQDQKVRITSNLSCDIPAI